MHATTNKALPGPYPRLDHIIASGVEEQFWAKVSRGGPPCYCMLSWVPTHMPVGRGTVLGSDERRRLTLLLHVVPSPYPCLHHIIASGVAEQ